MARPTIPDADKLKLVQGRVPQSDVEYLALWNSEQGLALREVIRRCRKMWPKGPFTAGGGKKKGGRPIVTPKLKAYAEGLGVEPKQAAAAIVGDFLTKQQAEKH